LFGTTQQRLFGVNLEKQQAFKFLKNTIKICIFLFATQKKKERLRLEKLFLFIFHCSIEILIASRVVDMAANPVIL
jgi:hypothetical protein